MGRLFTKKWKFLQFWGLCSHPREPISVKFCTPVPLVCAKFQMDRFNESPLRGENIDFWPVSKFNNDSCHFAAILPVNRPTASAHCSTSPKRCMVVELVVPILKAANHFSIQFIVFPLGVNADFWPLGKFKYRLTLLRGVLPVNYLYHFLVFARNFIYITNDTNYLHECFRVRVSVNVQVKTTA